MVLPSRWEARKTKGRGGAASPLGPLTALGSKMRAYCGAPAVSRSIMPNAPRRTLAALPGGKKIDSSAWKWKRNRQKSKFKAGLLSHPEGDVARECAARHDHPHYEGDRAPTQQLPRHKILCRRPPAALATARPSSDRPIARGIRSPSPAHGRVRGNPHTP